MAELAEERENQINQGRGRDTLDGDNRRSELLNSNDNLIAAIQLFHNKTNIEENQIQGMASVSQENAELEDIGQKQLDQMIEEEIDSPVREQQKQEKEKKERKQLKKASTSRSFKSREGSSKREQPPRNRSTKNMGSVAPTTYFDFSSDDDIDMEPEFNLEEAAEGFETESSGEHMVFGLPHVPPTSSSSGALVKTRSAGVRKSTRQQSKIDKTSNAPIKRGAGKKSKRM